MSEPVSRGAVLVVDDDLAVGKVLGALLGQAKFSATVVSNGRDALATLEKRPFDVVVTDIRMPDLDGMALFAAIQKRWPETAVVLMTAHASVPLAVEAMKAGAADFVSKPFEKDEIIFVVEKACRQSGAALAPALTRPLVGASAPMAEVEAVIAKAAPTSATVLIRGESGTGKELAARAIHEKSPRAKGPFVAVNCAALPENLLEAELFGYEKGAFTGATQRKPGRVELAGGGTFFLDEIGDVPLGLQVKLLRLLQEKEFERVGGTSPTKADVRFVAATHRPLEKMVADGTFRQDLFYRLQVVPLNLPSLAERPGDIPLLAEHFLAQFNREHQKRLSLSDGAKTAIAALAWPGNVRQLQNFIERLVVLSDAAVLDEAAVRTEYQRTNASSAAKPPTSTEPTLEANRRVAEKAALEEALAKSKNNRTVAARLLGISRRTLYNKLAELGLE